MKNQADDGKPIAVSLPARSWNAVLALADQFIQKTAKPKLEEFQKRGAGPDDMPDEIKAALMGPIFARSAISDVLCDAGFMKSEAKAALGADKLAQMAKTYYDRRRKSNGLR